MSLERAVGSGKTTTHPGQPRAFVSPKRLPRSGVDSSAKSSEALHLQLMRGLVLTPYPYGGHKASTRSSFELWERVLREAGITA